MRQRPQILPFSVNNKLRFFCRPFESKKRFYWILHTLPRGEQFDTFVMNCRCVAGINFNEKGELVKALD